MWWLHFIPDNIIDSVMVNVAMYIIAVLTLLLGLFGIFSKGVPAIFRFGILLGMFSAGLLLNGPHIKISYDSDEALRSKIAALTADLAKARADVKVITEVKTETKVVHDVQVQIKEKIKEVAVQIDKDCPKVDPVAINILNQAALNKKEDSQ
jgi:hypothetical protein